MPDYTLTLRPISIGTYPTDPAPVIMAQHYPPKRAAWGNDYGTLRYAATTCAPSRPSSGRITIFGCLPTGTPRAPLSWS